MKIGFAARVLSAKRICGAHHTSRPRPGTDGQYAQSRLGYVERMLHIDPLATKPVCSIIFSLAAQGERDRALSRFNEFENKVEPSKETPGAW